MKGVGVKYVECSTQADVDRVCRGRSLKLTAELSPRSHARIDNVSGFPDGTYELTIDDVTFSGSMEDVEDVMDSLQHDLMLLRTSRPEPLPLVCCKDAARGRHPSSVA